MCSTPSSVSSEANSRRNPSTARPAIEEETTRQMRFCEDDCEMRSTSARMAEVVLNIRPNTSGTPTNPGPPTVINVRLPIAVSALPPRHSHAHPA